MQGDVETDRTSPNEDGFAGLASQAREQAVAAIAGEQTENPSIDYLKLVRDARPRLTQYYTENLQAPLDANYRAFRNKHFAGSKYWHTDYRNRSKLFRPKTRTAVRKSDAAAVAALFSTSDAVKMSPGDDSNPLQAANAALIQEVFNYRTDRTSGMAAMPWFRICAGAHQDGMITSACVSKQYWKLELRKAGTREEIDPTTGETVRTEVYEPFIDRPDSLLIPLENIEIDPAASWLAPIQSAAVFIAKYPMSIDEVIGMQEHPLNPWNKLSEDQLRGYASTTDQAARQTRQAREGGNDRLDSRYTGTRSFEIVWVYEVFIRYRGEDICFYAAQDKAYLTEPKPVREIYPEQGGERPYTFGVINLESHRLFPMSPVESWQQQQIEINDFANLILDTAKLGVAPVTKVVRGKNVDLTSLTRRGPNSQIIVEDEKDVTWDKPPDVSASAFSIVERLNVDFDDQAGQFNSGSVQTNRSLNETVGGMRLIAGSANAVTEFDQRVWIETWVEPTIAQIVKLIQYYENDETILALCGKRAKLLQKFGVSAVDDHLMQQQVTVRVDAGVGNADPMERLAKMAQVTGVLMPLFKDNPKVASGELEIDLKAISDEAWGLAGWRDGDRFVRKGQPVQQSNPIAEAEARKKIAEAAYKEAQTHKIVGADIPKTIADTGKVKADTAKTKVDTVLAVHGAHQSAQDQEHRQGQDRADQQHRHGMEKAGMARDLTADKRSADGEADQRAHRDREFEASREDAAADRAMQAVGEGGEGAPAPSPPPAEPPEPEPEPEAQESQAQPQLLQQLVALLGQPRQFRIVRGPDNRIAGIEQLPAQGSAEPPPQPSPSPFTDQAGPPPGGLVV